MIFSEVKRNWDDTRSADARDDYGEYSFYGVKEGDGFHITSLWVKSEILEIPDFFDSLPVTALSLNWTFEPGPSVRKLILGANLTSLSISDFAFPS